MVVIITIAVIACNNSNNNAVKEDGIAGMSESISPDSMVNRGRYLVTIMGCNDCHSPKIMGPMGPVIDTLHMLSGHPANMPIGKAPAEVLKSWMLFNPTLTAYVGPWGTSFAANITSDETGIGNWSEAQFFTAIRKGKSKGLENNRSLLPPMPWEMFRNATDVDLSSIFAYLKSTKPVENRVPPPIPPDQVK